MNDIFPSIAAAAPEIFVCVMACALLVADVFRRPTSAPWMPYAFAQAALAGAAALTLTVPVGFGHGFNGMFVFDELARLLKLAILGITFLVFAYSRDYLRARDMYRGEYFVIGLFGVAGMMVMVSASHFLTIYLGLELLSLSLYALVAFRRDSGAATEAAMKYFVLGAMASGILLYGMSLIYGVTGSLEIEPVRRAVAGITSGDVVLMLGLVFIIVGVAFKLGVVPFHMWVPDVYHGAPTAVTLYVGTAPELAAFALVMRLLVGGLEDLALVWQDMLIIIAILSMLLGNVIAIAQTNLKRMLAYSAISHMGFFLLGILSATQNGYGSALFYVLIYAVMSLGAFGMIILLSRSGFEAEQLDDFKGLNDRSPWHAFLMLVLMFSLAGVPPTVGFYAKLLVIQSIVGADLVWLAVLSVIFAVIGAYYYLRVVKLMYFDEPVDSRPIEAHREMRVLIGANALALIAVMPWVGVIVEWCITAVAGVSVGVAVLDSGRPPGTN